MKRLNYLIVAICMSVCAFTFSATVASAQEKRKTEYVMATAMGTSTQLGKVVSVDLSIRDYSTPEDQKVLVDAFKKSGSKGVANALGKMEAKGRIAITGTLGFDVNYIREFTNPDGTRKIRFVTDRPIRFGELWTSSRTVDYSLSMGEITLSEEKDKSKGTILPIALFTINKEKELTVETFKNPWNLVNIRVAN